MKSTHVSIAAAEIERLSATHGAFPSDILVSMYRTIVLPAADLLNKA